MTDLNMEKAKREQLRWLILLALYAAEPMGTSEAVVKNAIEPVVLDVTMMDKRRQLDYLAERNLIKLTQRDCAVWQAKINRYGIDVVEYTVECDPGIARPKQW